MIETKFKDTEVGKIPVDWEITSLDDICEFRNGYTPSKRISAFWTGGTIPWFRMEDIRQNGRILSDAIQHITTTAVKGELFSANTIIMSTTATIGEHALLIADSLANQRFTNFKIRKSLCNKIDIMWFYWYCYKIGEWCRANIHEGGLTAVNIVDLAKLTIPIPPLAEQQRIAEALSNIDSLIENLDKLIEKKRLIKQGAMQELLTGKKRLPGFTGEWGNQNITTLCTIKARIGWQGLTTNEYLPVGDYILVTGTDFKNGYIDWKSCYYVSEWRYQQDHNIQIRNGDILITKDGTIGKVAYIENLPKEGTLNSGVFVIRTKDDKKLDNAYLSWFFKSKWFVDFINQLSAGSTINHLYQKDFTKLNIIFPTSVDEQRAIALILSSMDTNIDVLEQKRDKYIAIKKGMMQQLLTGKIRLI